MTITKYFEEKYFKAKTAEEWEMVSREEEEVYRCYNEMPCTLAEWAVEKGVNLEAKSRVKGYLELQMWLWDMEEEYE